VFSLRALGPGRPSVMHVGRRDGLALCAHQDGIDQEQSFGLRRGPRVRRHLARIRAASVARYEVTESRDQEIGYMQERRDSGNYALTSSQFHISSASGPALRALELRPFLEEYPSRQARLRVFLSPSHRAGIPVVPRARAGLRQGRTPHPARSPSTPCGAATRPTVWRSAGCWMRARPPGDNHVDVAMARTLGDAGPRGDCEGQVPGDHHG
jgi:hypothetical protein